MHSFHLYPALQELEKRGLVETRKEGRKKFYMLTSSGRTGAVEACEYFCTVYADIFREYGAESYDTTTRDSFGEIVDHLIDNYVEKILAGAASGHTHNLTNDNGSTVINYVYFPYKPALQCINDLLEIEQAGRGTATAGLQWLVLPDDNFYMLIINRDALKPIDFLNFP